MSSWLEGSLTVKEISDFTGKSEVWVRKALENGSLGIGAYTKDERGSYYISPKLAWERLGYRRDEPNDDYVADCIEYFIQLLIQYTGSREMLGNSLLLDRHNGKRNTDNSE